MEIPRAPSWDRASRIVMGGNVPGETGDWSNLQSRRFDRRAETLEERRDGGAFPMLCTMASAAFLTADRTDPLKETQSSIPEKKDAGSVPHMAGPRCGARDSIPVALNPGRRLSWMSERDRMKTAIAVFTRSRKSWVAADGRTTRAGSDVCPLHPAEGTVLACSSSWVARGESFHLKLEDDVTASVTEATLTYTVPGIWTEEGTIW